MGVYKMQANQNKVIYTLIISTILILALGCYTLTQIPEAQEAPVINVPTANEIATEVLTQVTIPTAEEIALLIDMPDTIFSVLDYQEELAIELATKELDDDDVREEIAEAICDECDDVDFDEDDITRIKILNREDIELVYLDEIAELELELKVYFDNDGDEDESETAKVNVIFDIEDLDRGNDYEDTEAELSSVTNVRSCSTD